MFPVEFKQQTTVIPPPEGTDNPPVPIYEGYMNFGSDQDPKPVDVTISCWQMTPEEMQLFLRTGKIYLLSAGPTPPVYISPTSPFPEKDSRIITLEGY